MSISIFEKNVKNAWGEKGVQWLLSLPAIVETLSQYWALTNIDPVSAMSWNYVAFAIQNKQEKVVLKIGFDRETIKNEYLTLQHFTGRVSVQLLDYHKEYNAILLQRAMPGYSLKSKNDVTIEEKINLYSQVVKNIGSLRLSHSSHGHVSTWLNAIDHIQNERVDSRFVDKAKQLRHRLMNSVEKEYLCHGDLHFENIIQDGENWLAIDPKGIVGEMAFEAAAFDLLNNDEMEKASAPLDILSRVSQLSTALAIDPDRLLSWIFLRVILSIQWFIEDKGDPRRMLTLANHVYPLLKS